jgi:hypothetical protein
MKTILTKTTITSEIDLLKAIDNQIKYLNEQGDYEDDNDGDDNINADNNLVIDQTTKILLQLPPP